MASGQVMVTAAGSGTVVLSYNALAALVVPGLAPNRLVPHRCPLTVDTCS